MKYLLIAILALGIVNAGIQGFDSTTATQPQADIDKCTPVDPNDPNDPSKDYTIWKSWCWLTTDLQQCNDNLGDLDTTQTRTFTDYEGNPASYDGGVYSDSKVLDGSEKVYTVKIGFTSDYTHDITNCVSHDIYFYDQAKTTKIDVIPTGTPLTPADRDIYYYNSGGQFLEFQIDHDKLVSDYKCDYAEETEQYVWTCHIYADIIFSGSVQYAYYFTMQTVLPRETDASITVNITKNTVTGDCCENTLSIESSLHFCTDLICTDGWDDTNNTFERRAHFFVAHVIDTAEFKDYELQGKSIKIGPFLPKIHDQSKQRVYAKSDASKIEHGGYVYELESFAAFSNLKIEAVSVLEDPNIRRLLQASDDQSEFFKAEKEVSVVGEAGAATNDDDDADNSTVLSIGFIALLSLLLF